MSRARVSPFEQGTAERILHDRYRKEVSNAEKLEKEAAITITAAKAARASAENYADALRALGHGNVIGGQRALPNYNKLIEDEPSS